MPRAEEMEGIAGLEMPTRFIVHLDMDAFFASIEQRDNPQLKSKPVIVGARPKKGKGRGVVSTCSYEARKFGIRSAMPISTAFRLCPQGIYLRPDMEKYRLASEQIFKILAEFSPDIEPVSIDEAFLDLSQSYHLFGTAYNACLILKSRIKKETGLTASVGLAPTRMAAKIASDLEKPDGLVEVSEGKLLDFLWPLAVDRIWGLGEKSCQALEKIGIKTIGDLARHEVNELVGILGKNGASFWQLANGIDESEVQTESEAKSVSNETTFEKDTLDDEIIESELMRLGEEVARRLRQTGFKCRTITLKIRLSGFITHTRSTTVSQSTNRTDIIASQIKHLYRSFAKKNKKVRLVGVKAGNLNRQDQEPSLFPDQIEIKKEAVDKVVDKIKDKFGDGSIYLAASKSRGRFFARGDPG
jgi:DNA polymerase-4